jgi:7-cyano-7-deazaguanine reductase
MALTKRARRPFGLDCIRNSSPLPLLIELDAHEFSWNCPLNPNQTQPDYGQVFITYIPDKKVAETKSLKFYLQEFRYRDAFNEELATRICMDLSYWLQPTQLTIKLAQTSRGGIQNTCTVTYERERDKKVMEKYEPKKDFRGGWPAIPAK